MKEPSVTAVTIASTAARRSRARTRAGRRVGWLAAFALGAGGAFIALPAHGATAAAPVDFYVSPTGSDSNSGTSAASPFATLQRAQTAVRGALGSASGGVTVNLAGGEYRLSSPLTLTPADSGSPGAPVTWQAEPGAFPVISGGVPISGWTQTDAGKNIWSAPAPTSLATRQLYINGARALRASGSLPVSVKQTSTGYTTASGDPMAKWRNPSGIEFVYKGGLGAWTEPRCPVSSISSTTITMAQPCWNNSTKRVLRTDGSGRTYELVGRQSITESPTSVENAYELLAAGHWYLDPSAHRVYYIPRANENVQTEDVEAAALPTLVSAVGSQSAAVHDIALRGLQFSYATDTDTSSPQGFSEIQATYTITGTHGYSTQGLCTFVSGGTCPYGNWTKMPGNVSLAYDHGVTFDHDYFVHLGAAGLDLGDGSQNDSVTGCVFTDISGNGLDLGGVDINKPANAAQHTSGNTIADNHFYNTSVEYHGGVAIDIGYAETTTVAHNQLDHLPYTGISVGWGGWPDKVKLPAEPNYSNHNLFQDNLIYDHMSVLGDGGAIYTNGITGSSLANGEHITGTLVHDQASPTGHGLYTDNGSSYITITGNGEYNIAASVWGSKHTNYTLNNGTYDPLDIEGNYWTNGPAAYNAKAVLIKNNTNITGASQIPASITANAGLEPGFRSILNWKPAAGSNMATTNANIATASLSGHAGWGELLEPPMGWSSWSSFHGGISEALIESQAAAMHTTLQKYGYEYVNVDAGWSDHVDQNGRDAWNTAKFPDGIPAVAAYVHKLGLKFGIYLVPGIPKAALDANSPIAGTPYRVRDIAETTQPGNTAADGSARIDFAKPGADAYMQSQANLLASWGVDYIKMDFVGPGGGRVAADNRPDIEHWHAALLRTGRPIRLELSNSLSFANAALWAEYSNGWRIEGDVECYSKCPGQLTSWGMRVVKRFADAPQWLPYAGPGHWNDLDSVEVGNGAKDGLTADEKQSVVTLWSIESAPLLLGTDLTKLDPADLPLITNREVIAVDQSGRPAHPVSQATPQQVWFSQQPGHSYTVALFNLGDTAAPVTAHWSDLGLPSTSTALVRDLWQHKDLGRVTGGFTATLAPHASMLLSVRGG